MFIIQIELLDFGITKTQTENAFKKFENDILNRLDFFSNEVVGSILYIKSQLDQGKDFQNIFGSKFD